MSISRTLHHDVEATSPANIATDDFVDLDLLWDRLRSAGVVLVFCTDNGVIDSGERRCGDCERIKSHGYAKRADDWLARLIFTSPMVARMMRDAAKTWGESDEPSVMEPIPGVGLWFAPIPLHARPRRRGLRSGYAVLVLMTDAMLTSEHLPALCQSAKMDFELTRKMLQQLPPVPANDAEVARVIGLARYLYEEFTTLNMQHAALDSTGRQLAETYEEISLLYTIIGSMSQISQPERFVQFACEELLGTLPYRWIGALLADDPERLKALAGQFYFAGELPAGVKKGDVRTLVKGLLADAHTDEQMVLDPGHNPAHAAYASLGNSVLVQGVTTDEKVIGILIAGEKDGPDSTANNVDMKLLAAIAGHMSIFLENVALYEDLNAMFLGTLEALTASIDAKDRYTCGHSQRVAQLTAQLARAVGLDENLVKRMHIGGLVHDVGKIGVPERVLLKPGKLTADEFEWITRHPEMGYRILKDIPQLQDILPGVLYHHERWDGTGYPKGLRGEEIPQIARMIGLADAFDAMSSTRTYRSSMSREQALREIVRCAGTQFDPELAPVFARLDFREYDRLVQEHHAGGPMSAAA